MRHSSHQRSRPLGSRQRCQSVPGIGPGNRFVQDWVCHDLGTVKIGENEYLAAGKRYGGPLKARGRLVSLRTHAVRESEIELYFRRAHAGRLRALSLVLVEPLSTHRFWNMPPSWEGGCCCRDPRSWARQRDGIRRQGYGVSQRSSVGSARGYRQTTNQGHHKPTYSPGHFPLILPIRSQRCCLLGPALGSEDHD